MSDLIKAASVGSRTDRIEEKRLQGKNEPRRKRRIEGYKETETGRKLVDKTLEMGTGIQEETKKTI